MSIRLSTSTKGPVKQLGGGSSVQRWAAEGGKGNAPPVTILLKIRHKIIANTTYTPLQIFGAQGSKMLWKNNSFNKKNSLYSGYSWVFEMVCHSKIWENSVIAFKACLAYITVTLV